MNKIDHFQIVARYFLSKLPTELGCIEDLADEAQDRYGLKMRISSFIAKIKREYPEQYKQAFLERKEYQAQELKRTKEPPQSRYHAFDRMGITVFMTREQLAQRGIITLNK